MFDQSGVTVATKTVMIKAPEPKASTSLTKQELNVSYIFLKQTKQQSHLTSSETQKADKESRER